MATAKKESINGMYVAYFTGIAGSSMGMFVFNDGTIAGADVGGGFYDGEYSIDKKSHSIEGSIKFTMEAGGTSITGATADAGPLEMQVPLNLDSPIQHDKIYQIQTPAGPVNAKFKKIRGLN